MIEVIDAGVAITVKYIDDAGNEASCQVLGESVETVENRADEYVKTHNLKDQASEK